jgi:thiamine transport system permease protein
LGSRRDRRRRAALLAVAALVPAAFLAIFFVLPVGTIVGMGFHPGALTDVARSARLRGIAWFTLWQAVVSTVFTFVVALPAAAIVARYEFPGRRLLRAAVTIPFVLPSVVVASAFEALGLSHGIVAILAAHVFFESAIVVRIVGGFWSNLDPRMEEAARLLGAGRLRAFVEVTLPRLAPALLSAAALVFLFTFSSFGIVLILGAPHYATLEVEIYRQTAQLLDLRVAAALTIVQMAAVLALLLVQRALSDRLSREQRLRAGTDIARRPRTARERAGVAAVAGATALVLGGPLAVLVARSFSEPGGGFGLRYYRALSTSRRGSILFVPPWEAIANSLGFAVVATAVALAVGVPAAVLVARRPPERRGADRFGGITRLFDALLMLPLGTSAVTIGFGFLVALDEPPLDLRGSPWLIPLAHALVAAPFVVRVLVPVLRSVDERLREAAAMLGASPSRAWREVDLPIAARGALVAAGFAFAVSLGEFGATVFVARPDYPTLPVAIFRFLGQPGDLNAGQAAALSTILMVVTVGAVLAIDRFRAGELGEF